MTFGHFKFCCLISNVLLGVFTSEGLGYIKVSYYLLDAWCIYNISSQIWLIVLIKSKKNSLLKLAKWFLQDFSIHVFILKLERNKFVLSMRVKSMPLILENLFVTFGLLF